MNAKISRLWGLAQSGSQGRGVIEDSVIGANGYGFVFRDPVHATEDFVTMYWSAKAFNAWALEGEHLYWPKKKYAVDLFLKQDKI